MTVLYFFRRNRFCGKLTRNRRGAHDRIEYPNMESPCLEVEEGGGPFGAIFLYNIIEIQYNLDVADDVLAQDTTMGQKAGMT